MIDPRAIEAAERLLKYTPEGKTHLLYGADVGLIARSLLEAAANSEPKPMVGMGTLTFPYRDPPVDDGGAVWDMPAGKSGRELIHDPNSVHLVVPGRVRRSLRLCWCDEETCPHSWSGIDFNLYEHPDLPFTISADREGRVREWWPA